MTVLAFGAASACVSAPRFCPRPNPPGAEGKPPDSTSIGRTATALPCRPSLFTQNTTVHASSTLHYSGFHCKRMTRLCNHEPACSLS